MNFPRLKTRLVPRLEIRPSIDMGLKKHQLCRKRLSEQSSRQSYHPLLFIEINFKAYLKCRFLDVTPPKSENIDKGGDPGIRIFNEHKLYSDIFCSAHIMRNSGVYAISKGKVFEHLK